MTSRPRESRGDTRFALAVGLGFLLLAALGMAYHELWRDEWQSWLIATQSDSFGELIQRIKDESHTPLWLLCLYAIGKLTDRPEAMQAFHLLIATTSVFVFARHAPFRRWEKALFPLGYFMLYEYAIISRHYGLGVLFVSLFCATLRRGNYLLSTALLIGMAWSSHQGILIAVPLQLMLLLRRSRPVGSSSRWMRIGVSCLFLLALIVAMLVVVPPRLAEDDYLYAGLDPLFAARSINTVWNAYVPVPQYADGRVLWDTNLLGTFNGWVYLNPETPPAILASDPLSGREVVALLLSLVLLLGAVRALAPDRTIMIVFSLTTLAMLLFSYSVFFGWMPALLLQRLLRLDATARPSLSGFRGLPLDRS